MADIISRLKLESGEFDSKLKRAGQEMLAYSEHCKSMGLQMGYANKDAKEFAKALGDMKTVSQTARGKLNELTEVFTNLKAMYNQMTDDEKQNTFGKGLAASLDKLKTRIDEAKQNLNSVNAELGNTKQAEQGATSGIDGLTSALGINLKSLAGWGAALGAGKVALDVVKDAFMQSESNIDEWGRTVKSSEAAYDLFLNTINGGNWSNFFTNLSEAVRGARDLYDALDRLGSVKSNNQAAIAFWQQEVQRLRQMKEEGKDVDEQLTKATEKLRGLQQQAVNAGKVAGTKTIVEVLKNRIAGENVNGINISEGTLKGYAGSITRNGQSVYDNQAKIYSQLTAKARDTRVVSRINAQGVNTSTEESFINLNKLTKEQQKQYLIAKAITEGKSEIKTGIEIYAQALSEEAGSIKEQIKGNRYVLRGASGSGGSSGGKGKVKKDTKLVSGSIADLTEDLKYLQQEQQKATSYEEWETYADAIKEVTNNIKELKGELPSIGGNMPDMKAIGLESIIGQPKPDWKSREDILARGQKSLDKMKTQKFEKQEEKDSKNQQSVAEGVDKMVSGFSSMTTGLEKLGIELPAGMQGVISGIQTVSSILTGISAIVSAIQIITAADTIIPFARGGIINAFSGTLVGNSYSGDNLRGIGPGGQLYGLNAGEVVLNRSQVGNLASQLEGSWLDGVYLDTIITAEDIRLVMNNNGRRTGRGEYVQTNVRRR